MWYRNFLKLNIENFEHLDGGIMLLWVGNECIILS